MNNRRQFVLNLLAILVPARFKRVASPAREVSVERVTMRWKDLESPFDMSPSWAARLANIELLNPLLEARQWTPLEIGRCFSIPPEFVLDCVNVLQQKDRMLNMQATKLLRCGAEAAQRAHNPWVGGSSPSTATKNTERETRRSASEEPGVLAVQERGRRS